MMIAGLDMSHTPQALWLKFITPQAPMFMAPSASRLQCQPH